MIIPIRCFTCGNVLADKWIPYVQTVQEYKNKYGFTEIIKKTDSAFKKMVKSHNKTLKSYEHLIDFNECGKRIEGFDI